MRQEYARKLPEQLALIESLWHEIAGGSDSRRDELLRTAHSMAGAAATFGLPKPKSGFGQICLESAFVGGYQTLPPESPFTR